MTKNSLVVEVTFKIIALAYIYQLGKFVDLVSYGSKDIFKNAPCLVC